MNAPALDIHAALDPSRSCVIEACAGSGKTWLLVARMLRALLAGAQPAEILALTFTRKAAQEMRERLDTLLMELATLDDADAVGLLTERGLPADEAERQLPHARRLCHEMLAATPAIAIDTFHGWFIGLARRAPLAVQDAAGTLGATLDEAAGRLFEEAWQRLALYCGRSPTSRAGLAFGRLLATHGLFQTRILLERWSARSVEWRAFTEGQDDPATWASQQLAHQLGASDANARAAFVAQHRAELDSLLLSLAQFDGRLANWGGAAIDAHVKRMHLENAVSPGASALAPMPAPEANALFDGFGKVILKSDGSPRASTPTKKILDAWGAEAAHAFAARLARLVDPWIRAREAHRVAATLTLNADLFTCGVQLLEALDGFKRESRRIAFADVETLARRLLGNHDITAYMHERLDARIRHVLIDEFQDTNPVQWHALRGWFEAYGDDASRPGVFIVGDPKQSIYRFRRADARLFDTARDWLCTHYAAQTFAHNQTRRNAAAIVAVVNQLFTGVAARVPAYKHFQPHTTVDADKPGRVELLPLVQTEPRVRPGGAAVVALRDPLTHPAADDEDRRARAEGAQVAARIRDLLAGERVRGPDGQSRALRCADVLLLARRRRDFAAYEAALREAGIPLITARAGGLLDSLEARDLGALLTVLMTPSRNLWLAHVLKSPLMGATDDDLLVLAGLVQATARADAAVASWWQCLMQATGLSTRLLRSRELLRVWHGLAGVLPVHDLLDRILADSDARACYATAVAPHQRNQVLANLDAFIELALNVDSGRFPSLPRFLDELRRMAHGSEQEAPGEGAAAREDAVRLMTVHAAKGLEAPAVFLLGANSAAPAEKGYRDVVVWPPDATAPQHFSMLATLAAAPLAQVVLVAAERGLDRIEGFNVLYVALTRAEQILVVSGAPLEREHAEAPYCLVADALAAIGYQPAPSCLEEALPEPLSTRVPAASSTRAGIAQLGADAAPSPLPAPALPPPTGRLREAQTAQMREGTRLHLVLQLLSDAQDARRAPPGIAWMAAQLGVDVASAQRLGDQVGALCARASLSRFFDPDRFVRARNEMTYADAQGAVRRIDRLVEFESEVWVLDYKAQVTPAQQPVYAAQLQGYVTAMRAWQPAKAVHGGLIDLAAGIMFAV